MPNLISRIKTLFIDDNQLSIQLEHILGFKPKQLSLYQIALSHRSQADEMTCNNERLEFLGDAFLGAIVGEYLFKKYPIQDEGFLTELRSKIVRRESLDTIANRMGIKKLLQFNTNDKSFVRSHIFGNALEALVGAVYLDQGYLKTKKFIINNILKAYIDVETLAQTDTNYKNKLLNWAQTNKLSLNFEITEVENQNRRKVFTVAVIINNNVTCEGSAFSKKEAGQVAAKKALEILLIKSNA